MDPTIEDAADDPALRARMGDARPEIDPIVRAVVRARAAAALFMKTTGVRIGRYELVREVGTGGGGSVFVARDPELAREIAIKLIAAPDPTLRARALAEGQALAKLSHPNIVPVFDVGEEREYIYLVMELVRGDSLRALATRANVRDLIRAYREAGEGLVAAHAAGLVHRDFKPDNAMIGADRRVRVVDFGLAGAEGSAGRSGTPRYMAPEQRAGAPATPAIDQYAFAVALGEAVTRDGRGMPRWLRPIIARGSHPDPSARYPTLAAMLRALANDPRTRNRRRAIVVVPLVLAAVGFALGRDDRSEGGLACDDAAATAMLVPAWTPQRVAAMHDHVAALGTAFASESARRARTTIDTYARAWIASQRTACTAARGEASATFVERRAGCLASARNQLGAAIDVLAAVDRPSLAGAMRALPELPDLARCADPGVLAADVPPPPAAKVPRVREISAALDRVRVRIEAATPDAAELAAAAVADARAVAYEPLLVTALLAHGRALDALDRRTEARAPLEEAVERAMAVRADAAAVEAYARLIRARDPDAYAELIGGLRPVLGLARRLGARDRFAAALLHNNAGRLEHAAGHLDRARRELATAAELARGVTGPGATELAWVTANFALLIDDPALREQQLAEAVRVVRAPLGDGHPLTLQLSMLAAYAASDLDRVRSGLRAACMNLARLHPERDVDIVECGYELGILDLAAGDRTAARASFGLVLAVPESADIDATRVPASRGFAALLDGDAARARTELEALAAKIRPAADSRWYELIVPADVELARADVATAPRAERAAVDRAITYLERAAAASPVEAIRRRLAWARRRR